jgi:hypothetical protein
MTNHQAAREIVKLANRAIDIFRTYRDSTKEEFDAKERDLNDEENANALSFITNMREFVTIIEGLNSLPTEEKQS